MAVKIVGVLELDKKLKELDDETINKFLTKAGTWVKDEAKDRCPVGDGQYQGDGSDNLRASINLKVENQEASVFTNKFYAPFVHQGTGMYAVDGNGRVGYWIFVKNGDPTKKAKDPTKVYTLEEAKQIVAIMQSQGLDAYYTNGQKPQPFLTEALDSCQDDIVELLKQTIRGEK